MLLKTFRSFFALMLAFVFVFSAQKAFALEIAPYDAAVFMAEKNAGKPVALHFHASWCPTCRAQEKAFKQIAMDMGKTLPLKLFVADYDKETDLKKSLGVLGQSTIIVYKGNKELARVTGESDQEHLRQMLSSAL